ncbi:MAG: hypothetical protein JKP92_08710 [Alphaproteobacteria bacterium]|nr:hypothetical protein [Alphaproteobacteria bacterium]
MLLFSPAALAQSADVASPWVLYRPSMGLAEVRLPRELTQDMRTLALPEGVNFFAIRSEAAYKDLVFRMEVTESWAGPLTRADIQAAIDREKDALGGHLSRDQVMRSDDGTWTHTWEHRTQQGIRRSKTLYAGAVALRLTALLSPPGPTQDVQARQFLDSGRILPKTQDSALPEPWTVTQADLFAQAAPPPGTPFVPSAPQVERQDEKREILALTVRDPVRGADLDYIALGYRFPRPLTDANALELLHKEVLLPLGFTSIPKRLVAIPPPPGARAFEGLLILPGRQHLLRLRMTIAGTVVVLQIAKGPEVLVRTDLTTALLNGMTLR